MQACPRYPVLDRPPFCSMSRGGCKFTIDCVQGHGGSKYSTGSAGKQAQNLVRSLQTASLLGMLSSAVQEVDEQLAATMVSI